MSVEQYGSFLEAAIAINLLPQWQRVFNLIRRWWRFPRLDEPVDDAAASCGSGIDGTKTVTGYCM